MKLQPCVLSMAPAPIACAQLAARYEVPDVTIISATKVNLAASYSCKKID